MLKRHYITPENTYKVGGNRQVIYTPVVVVEDTTHSHVYLSGRTSRTLDGDVACKGDMRGQIREACIAVEIALDSVGATFSGRYDLSTAAIDITGTYLPAYAFNNLFSRIPILGIALGGGSREGLFGVTFKISGPIAQPQVFFNPLSAVAPGIFRKIFEFQRPTQ